MKKFMQHSYLILLILTCVIIVPTTLLLQSCGVDEPIDEPADPTTTVITTTTTSEVTTTTTTPGTDTTTTTTAVTGTTPTTAPLPTGSTTTKTTASTTFPNAGDKVSFADTLFIGDSRTVGLRDYGKISDATFFCAVSLSSNNLLTKAVEVSGHGEIKLADLLTKKQFKTAYIMLGINEIGGSLPAIAQKYQKIIDVIHQAQPDTLVIVQSTLHVTKTRHQNEIAKGGYFNNDRINNLNTHLAGLANGTSVRYLDMNPMFDDEYGCMMAEAAAGDGVHIKAKYYLLWRQYLDEHRITG
ncbi:MAG: hypothetical protein IJO75_03890 [Clostridia bacterium]|nr:hypothetical protein [Clostridia bacterium]